jgi:predicted component of type VI protein secretion system
VTVSLLVTNLSQGYSQDRFVFEQDTITIGRTNSCDVSLIDEERIVSKRHAKILCQGETVQLVDLYSKNLTYINDEQLKPGQPYPLCDGDRIRIANFSLEVHVQETLEKELDKSSEFIEDGFNPFQDKLNQLVSMLNNIREQYINENPEKRDRKLDLATKEAFSAIEPNDASVIISKVLAEMSGGQAKIPLEVRNNIENNISRTLFDILAEIRQVREEEKLKVQELFSGNKAAISTEGISSTDMEKDMPQDSTTTRFARVVDFMLESMIKLIKGPWQFRLELLGQSIINLPDSFSFHTSTVEELEQYFLDEGISEEEFIKRLALFEETVEEVLLHQVAVLDGYRLSVKGGTHNLLKLFDPEKIEEEMKEKGIKIGPLWFPYWFIPSSVRRKRLQSYLVKQHKTLMEDRSVFEKRIYRLSFIRGYLKTMDSSDSTKSHIKRK